MYINASLIREARMIFQHLMQRSPGEPRARKAQKQLCARCLGLGVDRPAVTMFEGTALCRNHVR